MSNPKVAVEDKTHSDNTKHKIIFNKKSLFYPHLYPICLIYFLRVVFFFYLYVVETDANEKRKGTQSESLPVDS